MKYFKSLLVIALALALGSPLFAESRSLGTTYLPLDHWAYPAIERAMAKGALPQQFLGQRPWTRTAVALLIEERNADPRHFADDDESLLIIHALEKEFAVEIAELEGERVRSAEIQDVYTRVTGISGTPLRDSYHWGQTIVNDFGRPYGEGANDITGATARATYSVFGFEGQGEFQHSPGIGAYTPGQIATLASIDHNPTPTIPNNAAQNNGELMDTYFGVSWKRAYLSFGRESNWWGPGESSAMLMTDNVLPMYMLKFDTAEPITLPWILKYLGPLRYQMFMGKMKGHLYPRQPYLHGEKASIMPTKNLEIGFTRTTVSFGFGRPWTFKRLAKTYFSVGDQPSQNGALLDPGDRRGGLDVNYKVPGLRNWLSIYLDSFVDDDPSPLAAPNRTAYHPGFYLSHLPGLPRLDFRAEGAYTQLPTEPNDNGYFFYTNTNYRDGYTMEGLLLGDWVGREGKGGELSSTYWFAPDRTVQVYWKDHMVAPDFIPGGAHQSDFGTNINYAIGAHWQAGGMLQYEAYTIPLLASGRRSDFTASLTLSYWPHQGTKTTK
ncbi:MAG TPA: capsule assembly Wzi family protein [Candidatus Koribacter sp.]|jgi:hypothetical protein